MKKKILWGMVAMAGILAMTACEQKTVEIKSEKAQEQANDTKTSSSEKTKNDAETKKEAQISDDIFDFQVSLDGKIFQVPVTYSEFTKAGWNYEGDEEEVVHPSEKVLSDWFQKGNNMSLAFFTNFDQMDVNASDSYLSGMVLEQDYMKEEDTAILLAKEIALGISTLDEVKAAYGAPASADDNGIFSSLIYAKDETGFMELGFDTKNGNVLTEITLYHPVMPENFEPAEQQDSPAEEKAEQEVYTAPESISTNIFDYTVSFHDALYQLPMPVSELEKNGWSIVKEASNQMVEVEKAGKVTLTKDGQTLWLNVFNAGEEDAQIEECLVSNLAANVKDCNVNMEISGGIKMGMSQKELEKILETYEYTKKESSYTYYAIGDPEEESKGYVIIVKDGQITGIEVND